MNYKNYLKFTLIAALIIGLPKWEQNIRKKIKHQQHELNQITKLLDFYNYPSNAHIGAPEHLSPLHYSIANQYFCLSMANDNYIFHFKNNGEVDTWQSSIKLEETQFEPHGRGHYYIEGGKLFASFSGQLASNAYVTDILLYDYDGNIQGLVYQGHLINPETCIKAEKSL